jgi:16S rRNA (guanine(966)-N(2))-methyltransferase RsmD
MRILEGRWAGRTLESPSGRVRPTGEAVRARGAKLAEKALSELEGGMRAARVADLFAGTGAVGIELLSRGARSCTFVENDPSALHALKANVAGLRLPRDRARIRVQDAIPLVEAGGEDPPWDLAYADPPWGSRKVDRVLAAWKARPFARFLLLEHAWDHPFIEDPRGEAPPGAEGGPRRGEGGPRTVRVGEAGLTLLRSPGRTARTALLAGALAFGAGACDRTPRLEAPVPEVVGELDAPPPLEASYLGAPVLYDLKGAVEALEREVPRSFGDLSERLPHPSNGRVHVAFEAERGPFEWSLVGDTARLSTLVTYRGRGWYDPPLAPEVSASCGTDDEGPPPRAVVTLASPLTVDEGWKLRSRTRVVEIRPASDDPRDQCTVTIFDVNVTERVLSAASSFLAGQSERIDAEVARVDLAGRLSGAWDRLHEPVELTDDVWLLVSPSAVSLGRIRGEGDRVWLDLGITAHPRLVLGPEPGRAAIPLPPLDRGAGAEGGGLRILLEARGHYEEAGRRLTRELEGEELSWAGQRFRFRSASLRGIGGGRVALGIRFDGSARGEIFLVGTPELDPEGGEIVVPDLDFDVATLNLLMRSATWIARDELLRTLRERARLPVSELMGYAAEKLDEGLNRRLSDQVRLEGAVEGTELLGVRATVEALHLQAAADARAVLIVEG